jgi:multicomponent Na+:H+ antiporter subunit D
LFTVSDQAAEDMLDRSSYIQAVLGEDTTVPMVLTSGGGK